MSQGMEYDPTAGMRPGRRCVKTCSWTGRSQNWSWCGTLSSPSPTPTSSPAASPGRASRRRVSLQARLAGEHLAVEHLAGLYSTRSTRAQHTARGIAGPAPLRLSPVIRNDLREIESRGAHTEPSDEVRGRLTAVLTEIVHNHPDQVVAAVSHGGAISAFLASILGIEADIFFFAAHASITRVRFHDGHWAVQSVNETDHLRQHKLVTY